MPYFPVRLLFLNRLNLFFVGCSPLFAQWGTPAVEPDNRKVRYNKVYLHCDNKTGHCYVTKLPQCACKARKFRMNRSFHPVLTINRNISEFARQQTAMRVRNILVENFVRKVKNFLYFKPLQTLKLHLSCLWYWENTENAGKLFSFQRSKPHKIFSYFCAGELLLFILAVWQFSRIILKPRPTRHLMTFNLFSFHWNIQEFFKYKYWISDLF